jgi:hypothetical protein
VIVNRFSKTTGEKMTVERWIRLIAGSFILISLALAHWVNPNWLWFTAFVGANMLQSSLTRWCLMEDILKKLGVGTAARQRATITS